LSVPLGFYSTRIRDFKVSNTRPVVGETVEITGYLEYLLVAWWYGCDGKTVKVMADGTQVASAVSTANGFFRAYWRPSSTGKFIVKAVFEGDISFSGCESTPVEVTVLTQEEKAREEQQFWIMVGGIAVIALVGIGVVAYMVEREREMQLLVAARRR